MPLDLSRMRANSGSVDRRQLALALRENGFQLAREGAKHEVWSNGTVSVAVPRTLKGIGTIRRILDVVIASRE
jgi:hypothetical protein